MTNQIQVSGTEKVVNPLCLDASQEFSVDQVNIIRQSIAPNLSEDELKIFLYNCVRTKLDPFARQIYAIKRGGKMCIQTGIDGFRLIAERTGRYAPGRDTEFLYDDKGFLQAAKVFIKKQTPDGTWHELSATAHVREYNPGQGLWDKMPHVMIEKCAEARALRRAFPADLSGLYTSDEMEQADHEATSAPTPPPQVAEPAITEDQWKALDDYLNGHTELRERLRKLCKIDDLRQINQQQLEVCRAYAKARMDAEQDAKNESE